MFKALKVLKVLKVLRVLKVLKVQKMLKVLKVLRVHRVLKVLKVLKMHKVLRSLNVLRVLNRNIPSLSPSGALNGKFKNPNYSAQEDLCLYQEACVGHNFMDALKENDNSATNKLSDKSAQSVQSVQSTNE